MYQSGKRLRGDCCTDSSEVCKRFKTVLYTENIITEENFQDYGLTTAAEHGRCDIIEAYVRHLKFHNKFNPADLQDTLHTALYACQSECVSLIMDLMGNFNLFQALCAAANSGDSNLYLMVKNKNPRNLKKIKSYMNKSSGLKLLAEACVGDNEDIVKDILNYGVICNEYCPAHEHPLSFSRSPNISRLLLQQGIDLTRLSCVNDRFSLGERVLQEAVLCNSRDMVDLLVKHGAKIEVSLLLFAYENCVNEGKTIVHYIIDKMEPKDINEFDLSGKAVLIEAVEKHDYEIVKKLLDNGADIDISDRHTYTPLCKAASVDDPEMVTLLLENGAKPDLTNSDNRTALMIAARMNNYAAFCALVDAGVDVNVQRFGHTLLSSLISNNEEDNSNLKFIIYLFENQGLVHLSHQEEDFCLSTVHSCISEEDFGLLYALIYHGGFTPSLLVKQTNFCLIQLTPLSDFREIFSPLCMALICGQIELAQHMIDNVYLTHSDLTLLPKHPKLRSHLTENKFFSCLSIIDKMCGSPPSLFKLAFVQVSTMLGSQRPRKNNVLQLKVPGRIQNALLFKSWEIGSVECSGDSKSYTYPKCEQSTKKFYPLVQNWPSYFISVPAHVQP